MTRPGNIPEAYSQPLKRQTVNWKISRYTLIAQLYFFYNAVFLPKGLLYTNILSPLFFYQQIRQGRKTYWPQFVLFLLVFDVFHVIKGVDLLPFVVSNLLFTSCYFLVISFYHFFNHYPHHGLLIRQLVVVNFIFAIIAIPFLFMDPDITDVLWWVNRAALAKHEFPRLKLLTYEASYYSLLMAPVFFYYIFKYLLGQIRHNKNLTLLLVLIPVFMSLSFGVIGAGFLTGLIMLFVFRKKTLRYKRTLIILASLSGLLIITALYLWFFLPNNPVTMRMVDIVNGRDTSARGRTTDSFQMAWLIASYSNEWFGCGLGQIKIKIADVVHQHFNYWGNYARYDIPNAIGETLAIFGITGVVLRLFLQWYLFFRTRVFENYYRLALFIFVFIYQFTGSFITNTAEYIIWALVFSKAFSQFNVQSPEA